MILQILADTGQIVLHGLALAGLLAAMGISAAYAHKLRTGEGQRLDTSLFEAGIIDPAKVVRIALQDAASIAGLMITTEAGIAEAPKREAGHAEHGHGGMGGM